MKLGIIFRFFLPLYVKEKAEKRGWQIRFNNMMPDKNMPVDFTN